MMDILEYKKTNNRLNARVKDASKNNFKEQDAIKQSYGNDSSVPQTIYNKIQDCLSQGNKARAILKVKMIDGTSYWVDNHFTPNNHNTYNNYSVRTNIIKNDQVQGIEKLYTILHKIEKN